MNYEQEIIGLLFWRALYGGGLLNNVLFITVMRIIFGSVKIIPLQQN